MKALSLIQMHGQNLKKITLKNHKTIGMQQLCFHVKSTKHSNGVDAVHNKNLPCTTLFVFFNVNLTLDTEQLNVGCFLDRTPIKGRQHS
jgi:hypothetical protein